MERFEPRINPFGIVLGGAALERAAIEGFVEVVRRVNDEKIDETRWQMRQYVEEILANGAPHDVRWRGGRIQPHEEFGESAAFCVI